MAENLVTEAVKRKIEEVEESDQSVKRYVQMHALSKIRKIP